MVIFFFMSIFILSSAEKSIGNHILLFKLSGAEGSQGEFIVQQGYVP